MRAVHWWRYGLSARNLDRSQAELQSIFESFQKVVTSDRCALLTRSRQLSWTVVAATGFATGPLLSNSAVSRRLIDGCWERSSSFLSEDLASDPKYSGRVAEKIRSVLCVPILQGEQRIQAILYADDPTKAVYAKAHLLRVESLLAAPKLQPTKSQPEKVQAVASVEAIQLTLSDLRSLYRLLATLMASGIPVMRALHSLQESSESQRMAKACEITERGIRGGVTLSKALDRAVNLAPQQLALLRIGERTGSLDKILQRLAASLEHRVASSQKIRAALVYPAFLLVGCLVVAVLAPALVLKPQLEMLAGNGTSVPLLTKAFLYLGRALSFPATWLLLAASVYGALKLLPRWWQRSSTQRLALASPGLGRLLRKLAELELAASLELSLEAGVNLLDALSGALASASCIALRDERPSLLASLKDGETLADSFRRSQVLTTQFCCLVEAGEEAGTLPSTLRWVARMAEMELDTALTGLTSMLEPLILLVCGVMVGLIVVATMLPTLKLLETV